MKSVFHIAVISAAIAIALPSYAGDDIKTLPAGVYDQLKSGKRLDKVFVYPSYDKTKGFKIGNIDYKAEYRSGDVMDYMPKALATLARPESPFTLHIAILKVSTKTFTGLGNSMGAITLEGRILDADGKLVAAFKTKEKAGSFGSAKDDYNSAMDKIASAIAVDLLQ